MPSKLAKRAALAAELEYAPQQSALLVALQEVAGNYRHGLRASRSAARGVVRSVQRTVPLVREAYQGAAQNAAARQAPVQANLAALGSAADPYKAAASTESALASQLLEQARVRAVGDMRARAVEARQGAAYEQRALRDEMRSGQQRVFGQMQMLAQQQGASASKIYQDLLDAAGERRIDLRRLGIDAAQLRETIRANRADERQSSIDSARRVAADRRDRRGDRWLKQSQQNDQFDQLEEARSWIRRLSAGGRLGTGRIREMLRAGSTLSVPIIDPTKRDAPGDEKYLRDSRGNIKVQAQDVPAFPNDLINAAYDLEELGRLSRPNVVALHRRGLQIGRRYEVAPRGSRRRSWLGELADGLAALGAAG